MSYNDGMRDKIFSGSSILIIGGSNPDIKTFAEDAKVGDAEVDRALNGLDGLSKMRAKDYTAILLDEHTPDLSAEEIITILNKESRSTGNIIVYSAESSPNVESLLKNLGVYAYLALGVDSDSRLHNSVIALLDGITVSGQISAQSGAGTGTKVFIVEDSVFIRDFITSKLLDHGFTIAHADNGAIAVPKIREEQPDIVLLDLELPGKHGLEVLKELKADAALMATPVIIFTNEHDKQVEKDALASGAAGFFFKATTDASDLIAQIKKLTD